MLGNVKQLKGRFSFNKIARHPLSRVDKGKAKQIIGSHKEIAEGISGW